MNINTKLLKQVLLATGALFVLWLIYYIFSQAIITINIQNNSYIEDDKLVVSVYNNEDEPLRVWKFGDTYIIPRSSAYIFAGDENNEVGSGYYFKGLKVFGNEDLQINLNNQNKANKLSGDSLGCEIHANNTYNYNCGLPNGLFKYDTSGSTWGNKKVFDMAGFSTLITQYNNGYLGISQNVDEKITYHNLTNDKVSSINLPPDTVDSSQITLLTNKTESSDSSFVVYDRLSKKLNYTKDTSGNYISLDFPEDFNSRFDVFSCEYIGIKAVCYYGINLESDSPEQDEYNMNNPKNYIVIYNFNSKETTTLETNGIQFDSFVSDSNDNIYGLSNNYLYSLNNDVANTKIIKLSSNVDAVSSGDSIVFIKGNGVYTIKDDLVSLVFKANNLAPNNVSVYGDKISVNTTAQGGVSTNSHSYIISNSIDDQKVGERLLDKIPIPIIPSNLVRSIDYSGKTINATLSLSVVSDRNTGKYFYANKEEYQRAKNDAKSILEQANIDLSQYNINYSY